MNAPLDDKSSTKSSPSTASNEKPPNTAQPQQRTWTSAITNILPLWLRGSADILAIPMAPQLTDPQRKQSLSTTSSALTGTYSLLDLLKITSRSGYIDITVEPRPSDPANPAPAELRISSLSGSIGVNMSAFNAPVREYMTSIHSKSGSIDAHVIHGVRTHVEAVSGSLNLRFVMAEDAKGASTLSTSCKSGRTNISVTAGTSEESIGEMTSSHSTISGSMTLRYPREWSGTFEGRSTSGSMNLHGPELKIVRQSPHEVVARKGSGGSRLELKTVSGSVDVYFE